MKTAETILKAKKFEKNFPLIKYLSKKDIIEAMEEYANQKVSESLASQDKKNSLELILLLKSALEASVEYNNSKSSNNYNAGVILNKKLRIVSEAFDAYLLPPQPKE